jgi:7-cyano-7-deazaguanine reductase
VTRESHSHGVRQQEQEGSSGPSIPEFDALKHKASEYAGLERFNAPSQGKIVMTSDEVTALCPVTAQPDFYTVRIEYVPREWCLESKSLKLYLGTFRDTGVFCEALTEKIATDIHSVLAPSYTQVTVTQKSRGGIVIEATSLLGKVGY